MNVVARVVLWAVVTAVGGRALATAVYAALDFPKRTSVSFTEPQMVHLAHRVQLGESLYPDWRTFPYVVDVFTPGYFWIVGSLGRLTDATIDEVQSIGRGVTLAFNLLGAVLLSGAVKQHGRTAMFAAGCLVVGSGAALWFGWMARPDLTSDVLGFAGFLAATSSTPAVLAMALLAAGVLCKQTAVLYVAAAAVALVWQRRFTRAVATVLGSAAATLAVLGAVHRSGEHRVFIDIVLEASSPWKWDHWLAIATRLLQRDAQAVVLCVVGAVAWFAALRGEPGSETNAKRWLALLAVSATFCGVGSAKFGSDVNYYLPLRFVAAAALAEIVGRLLSPSVGWKTIAAALLSTAAIGTGMVVVVRSLERHQRFNSVWRAKEKSFEDEIFRVAELGRSRRILTNCDDIALRIGNPFVDSFLFKMLVDSGRLQPTVLEERLRRGEYDMIVTTADLDDSRYLDSAFGMPRPLAAAILDRYARVSKSAFSYYRPKPSDGDRP